MLRRLIVASSLLAVASLLTVARGGEVKSGLQKGDKAGPFQVRNITGQKCDGIARAEVDSLCYR